MNVFARIEALPQPARALVLGMLAWRPLAELRRDDRRPLELPEHGVSAELYGDLVAIAEAEATETLGLLRLGDTWGAVTTSGIVTAGGRIDFPEDCSVCLLHQVCWYRGRLLVPSANLTTLIRDSAWIEEPVGIYEFLTGSPLDDSRACRHTFAVGDVYVAVHAYDYAEGSGQLELWWNRKSLTSIELPLRVLYMQWQGTRLHVTTADATIVF